MQFIVNMNMKAIKKIQQESSFIVDAITSNSETVVTMPGFNISPRGITTHCTTEQIALLHNLDEKGCQSKYQELLVVLRLNFKSGEMIEIETSSQIQSIRRVSQTEFEVNMGFSGMVQDGYRHISRYMDDLSSTETE
jgi:hypothetical protein